jgi:hypothetical protein
MEPMMLSQEPRKRELVWSGLAALCSLCGWRRVYQPGATVHRIPDEQLSNVIRGEFTLHRCDDFPILKTTSRF